MSRHQGCQALFNIQAKIGAVSVAALLLAAMPEEAIAQSGQAQGGQSATPLPTVSVDITKQRRKPRRAAPAPRTRVAAPPPPQPQQQQRVDTHDARTGTVGVYANSTSVATKTNTPLINIPQSISVLTKDFIQDNNFQTLTEVTRYVPGVAIHQGEGNRDELVIRGVDSSANFFVNGFRDDIQYFRDLYNTQSIEILKGPSALIFGRAAGGGLVNRTLKEADWSNVREMTATVGSWNDKRITADLDHAFNQNVAARLNLLYEQSDTFRDFGHFERYGINPTVTFRTDDTKVKFSYELYHDERFADRGNPAQWRFATGITGANAAQLRANPAEPFLSRWATCFCAPAYNGAYVNLNRVENSVEHDFGNGLTVKSATQYASFLRGYTNIYPGNGPLAGAVNIAQTTMNLAAYNNATNRNNLFNQTDWTWKTETGPVRHTITFGTEFGLQAGMAQRNTGYFPVAGGGLSNTTTVNPFAPTYFGPVFFIHSVIPGGQVDASSRSDLYVSSAYVQDQIDITRFLTLIAGLRFDRYDFTALDQNTNTTRSRADEKLSPRLGLVFKPLDNLSIYGAYSTSFLPASGDQFSALTDATLILEPQKFENYEMGVKYNINPRLLWTTAIYQLNRSGVPVPDPTRPGFSLPNGQHKIRGFESSLTGYVTPDWQSVFGYAYTDARIANDLSATIVAGNHVQLVPFHQFSWWNKYQFTPVWSAAVGAIYFSESFASSDNSVRLPGWWRFDAAVYARINETWKAQLNIENIFDHLYWASADGNNNLSPGQGRTFRLSATASF